MDSEVLRVPQYLVGQNEQGSLRTESKSSDNGMVYMVDSDELGDYEVSSGTPSAKSRSQSVENGQHANKQPSKHGITIRIPSNPMSQGTKSGNHPWDVSNQDSVIIAQQYNCNTKKMVQAVRILVKFVLGILSVIIVFVRLRAVVVLTVLLLCVLNKLGMMGYILYRYCHAHLYRGDLSIEHFKNKQLLLLLWYIISLGFLLMPFIALLTRWMTGISLANASSWKEWLHDWSHINPDVLVGIGKGICIIVVNAHEMYAFLKNVTRKIIIKKHNVDWKNLPSQFGRRDSV